jgi:oligopeptide transport system permease protein
MLWYTIRRIIYMIVTLWLIVTVTFVLMKALPGDPFGEAAAKLQPENLELLKVQYGLDKPEWQQYLKYMNHVIHGDLGVSYQFPATTVVDVIKRSFPASFELGMESLFIAIIIGLFLGIIAALNHNKAGDYSAMLIAIIGISIPSFVIGPLLSFFVGVKWGILPPGLWNGPEHRVLPAIALSFGTIAILARMMRASMLDVAKCDLTCCNYSRSYCCKCNHWNTCC